MAPTEADRRYLDRARHLARGGWGRVHPNPMVGCVLVRDGRVVGEGWHGEFGGPHAEVEALRDAGEDARGATAYVSLEPCAHHGKTPPCADALLAAEVVRVVYGARDPGDASSGGGERLRAAGVEVEGPLLEPDEARRDNPAFFHAAETRTPWVETKLAVSLDGKIAAAPGRRTEITGPEARERVHRLRAGFDAILVGSRTVEVDDPLLTVRHGPRPRKEPTRLVVDSLCRTGPGAALFRDVERAPVVLFTTKEAPAERIRTLEESGATVVLRPASPRGVELLSVLEWCWEHELTSILCEGGAEVVASLLEEDLCGRIDLFVAPTVLGDAGVAAFRPRSDGGDPLTGWRAIGAEANVGRDAVLVLERSSGSGGARPRQSG